MAWKQLIVPTIELSEVAGMCLSYARRVFGRPVVEPTAWSGWNNAKYKHEDRNFPAGVAVPVWFDWTGDVGAGRHRYGHVAVRMPDGKIWSSPLSGTGRNWFASVDDLTRAFGNGMSYVGWSEDISNGRVVTNIGEVDMVSNESCYNAFNGILMRPPTKGDLDTYVGKWNLDSLIGVLNDSKLSERAEVLTSYNTGKQALKDDWAGQIKSLSNKPSDFELIAEPVYRSKKEKK